MAESPDRADRPGEFSSPELPLAYQLTPRRAVTLRSVLLGLLGIIFICGLGPFNDHAVWNTFLIGGTLPVGLLVFYVTFILLLNGPLNKWFPRLALSSGELTVALGMTLVSCCIPTTGLMTYLPTGLISIHHYAATNPNYFNLLEKLNLPHWLFPTLSSGNLADRVNDPVITQYFNRAPTPDNTFMAHWNAVPWRAWLRPAIVWGIAFGAIWGAILCLMVIVRRQWAENERLPFPLAGVYLSLIENPSPGRAYNRLFSSRSFWIGAGIIFFIRGMQGLNLYLPKYVPLIPTQFDLHTLLSNPPWVYLDWRAKSQMLFFAVIGLTFFLQSKISFSLWFTYLVFQVVKMSMMSSGAEFSEGMKIDQTFGATVVFSLVLIWIGRHHWAMILRQMFGRVRAEDPPGRYLSNPLAGWGLVICLAVFVGWFKVAAGGTIIGGIVMVLMLLMILMVLARVVAETGLSFVQTIVPLNRPWIYAVNATAGHSIRTSLRSMFMTNYFHLISTHDTREILTVYAQDALKVADQTYEGTKRWIRTLPFLLCLVLSLGVGYLVGGVSTLYVEYAYGTTLNETNPSTPINEYGMIQAPELHVLVPTRDYVPPRTGPREKENRALQFGIGAVLTAILSFLPLRFSGWPLHPIGFLLCYTDPMAKMYTSIFIGWLLKTLIVKFGGGSLYKKARPFFIGIIVGEAGAAGFWLIVCLVRIAMGLSYQRLDFTT